MSEQQVIAIALKDIALDPDGKEWTVAALYFEERFGNLVSVTVERNGQTVVLDAADEIRWRDGAYRIVPNYQIGRHQA